MSRMKKAWARTEGYRYYGAVILGAGVISIVGNGAAYLLDELPGWAALAIHCSPPAIAILMVHLVYEIHDNHGGAVARSDREVWALLDQPEPAWRSIPKRRWIRRARLRWQVGRLAMVSVLQLGAVGVVGLALVYSYGGLQTLAAMAEWSGWRTMAFPVLIDAPAFIATIGVIQVMRQRRLEREARVAEERVAQSGEPMSDDADDAATELSSTVVDTDNEAVVDTDIDRRQWDDRRPIVSDRRIVDEPVIDEDRGRRRAVIDDRQWPVDSGFAQVEPVADTDIDSRQPVDNEVVDSVDQARVDSVVTDNGPVVDSVDSTVDDDRQVVDGIDNGPVDNAPESVDSVVDDTPTADIDEIVNGRHRADDGADNDSELAAAVVAETRTKVPAEGVAEALRRRREGDSYASIAEAIGIGSHSTVRSLVKAATKLDAAYAEALGEPHRPDLAVVSSQ